MSNGIKKPGETTILKTIERKPFFVNLSFMVSLVLAVVFGTAVVVNEKACLEGKVSNLQKENIEIKAGVKQCSHNSTLALHRQDLVEADIRSIKMSVTRLESYLLPAGYGKIDKDSK